MINKAVCDACRKAEGWCYDKDSFWSCPHLGWGIGAQGYGKVIKTGTVPPPGCIHLFEHAVSVNIDKIGGEDKDA